MAIPFLNFGPMHLPIRDEMNQAFQKVYDSYWYILGERVKIFESEYAAFHGVGNCIGLSNGLDALILALKSLNIQKGDEVIVPSNTYIASVLAVTQVGATPVFAEPDIHTYNINPSLIEQKITSATRVIMPVHLYGQPCEMDKIKSIADKYDLKIVEDNAQSHGALFKGRMTGTWGDVNATSFYPGKNLGALGDGGAITTDSSEIADKIRVFRNYGSEKKYYNEVEGYNMRLDELQAAFLSIKLKYLQQWTLQRQEIAKWYNEDLKDMEELILPCCHPHATHVYHLYVIQTNEREDLQKYLQFNGIGTLIHYPVPPHLQNAYHHLGIRKGSLPVAEKLANTVLSLPLWPGMSRSEVEMVTSTIKTFFKSKRH